MTPPADADTPAPASTETHSGWRTGIAAGGADLVVEFRSGIVAAGSPGKEKGIAIVNNFLWKSYDDSPSLRVRSELTILTPAIWLMRRSKSAREFYMWQYRLASGREYWVESD